MTGLTSIEAARRLRDVGPNEPVPIRRTSALVQLLSLFANPLVAILLVASAISAGLGRFADAAIIVAMVLLGVAITFWQTWQAQRAAGRLRALVAPTATVCRDGRWQEQPIRTIVPGDLVTLSAGDLIPADARLLESRDLSVQQSMLTGESLPADKHARAAAAASGRPLATATFDAPDLVFLGTSVISGTGTAVVLATGPRTQFGDIAARLSAKSPETEFERGLRHFSLLILRTTIALVLFIVLVGLSLRRDPLESLLFAVALGVGLTPEFLPMIESVTLTKGALRMAREQVIVKHLPAIQNFGSIDVLCSDKTGTLTAGILKIAASLDGRGDPSPRPLVLATINSRFQTGIHSPLDAAILAAHSDERPGYVKVDEIPFDFERRRLSVVADTPSGQRMLIAKGAAEEMFERASSVDSGGAVAVLDDARRNLCRALYTRLSADGFRVLAVAYRNIERRPAYSREDERDLVLAGFLTFADPVKPDVAGTIAALGRDGVEVKILTGDNELVATHVSRQVGLGDRAVVTGDDLQQLDDAALGHVAEQTTVFARMSPAHKNRVIAALRRRGHVVGFLGDGINDAPSLHAADVGISVTTAADVARDAAEIILVQSSLGVLHRGIIEGRRASGNMMKYLLMGTSSNFGNMFSMAAASVFLPFLPMLPTQIILNNFLYDVAQIAIPSDNVDDRYVGRPQRWDMRIVRDFMIFIGPISSAFDFLTFVVLIAWVHAGEQLFHTGWFVESLATQTLVLFVIRTMDRPWRSRPSVALTLTTLGIVMVGAILPATPAGRYFGFTPLPGLFVGYLAAVIPIYLGLVEIAKHRLVGRAHLRD